jgi:hypothetical protein
MVLKKLSSLRSRLGMEPMSREEVPEGLNVMVGHIDFLGLGSVSVEKDHTRVSTDIGYFEIEVLGVIVDELFY